MNTQYKIIPVADLIGNLSENGKQLLLSARYSNDRTKIIRCINHPQERILSTFIDGFDIFAFLNNYPTLTKKQSLIEMQSPEWSTELGDDL